MFNVVEASGKWQEKGKLSARVSPVLVVIDRAHAHKLTCTTQTHTHTDRQVLICMHVEVDECRK